MKLGIIQLGSNCSMRLDLAALSGFTGKPVTSSVLSRTTLKLFWKC